MRDGKFEVVTVHSDQYMKAAKEAAELMERGIFRIVLLDGDTDAINLVRSVDSWIDAEKLLLAHLGKRFA